MTSVLDFPDEVLELIFIHLPRESLLDLTLMSPRFNGAISNSATLMRQLPVLWYRHKKPNERALPSKSRKYCKVVINEVSKTSLRLLQFVYSHSSSLTWISFFKCLFMASEIHCLLSSVGANLKTLRMHCVKIVNQCDLPKIEMPKLRELRLNNAMGTDLKAILFMISTDSLQMLEYCDQLHRCDFRPEEKGEILEFLMKQSNLKSLRLPLGMTKEVFNHSADVEPFKFKASSLFLQLKRRYVIGEKVEYTCPNLVEFLKTQIESLSYLELKFGVLRELDFEVILKMNIKELQLYSCEYIWSRDIDVANFSIEELSVTPSMQKDPSRENERALCNILKCCQQIRILELFSFPLSSEVSTAISKCENLQKLNLFHCKNVVAMKYPSVEHLKVSTSDKATLLGLIGVNPQLKSLDVYNDFKGEQFKRILAEMLPRTEISYHCMD